MIGADLMILLFGLGCLALTWPVARAALQSARATRRNATIGYGAGAVVLILAGLYAVADAVLRFAQA